MIPIAGRPFAEWLVDWLVAEGMERITFLGGWKAECLVAHFGSGEKWDVSIDYVISSADTGAATRLIQAGGMIPGDFLLLYGDNYCPIDLAKAEAQWRTFCLPVQMTVYRNEDQYSRSNVVWQEGEPGGRSSRVTLFDPARSSPALAARTGTGVDIGCCFVRRDTIDRLKPTDFRGGLDTELYPYLAKAGRLGAYVTRQRYYGPSRPERMEPTERFFANPPCVLLDRDGVLNRKRPRAQYVASWLDWEWLPGAIEGLRIFAEAGWRILIVTNQAGVARGKMSMAELNEIHNRMRAEAAAEGCRIDGMYVCPHGWNAGCECRKPAPGMIDLAQRDWTLDLSRTWLCGDDDRDRQAAEAAGCRFVRISEDTPLDTAARMLTVRVPRTREVVRACAKERAFPPLTSLAYSPKESPWQNAS
jgi:D-glycero-D-manno-heptose 1,7-bisphosphate phosphatase